MKRFILIITIGFIHLIYGSIAFALDQYPGDTTIYGVSTATIQPNVLIILDSSGSMSGEVMTGDPYNPATVYPITSDCNGSACATDTVYRWRRSRWQFYIGDVYGISCGTAKDALLTTGTYNGRLRTSGSCSSRRVSSATGNYINWLALGGGTRSKMEVAQEVLTNLLNATDGVKFGLMRFNNDDGGRIAGVGSGGYEAYVKDMDEIYTGVTTNREALVTAISNVTPGGMTPLAETLYEAMQCYKGEETEFNGSYTYTTPIEYNCQQNYVILLSDGMSTSDRDAILATLCSSGDCDGDGYEPAGDPSKSYDSNGSDYLDDVAKYMYDTDLLTDSGGDVKTTGKQNVKTFTIGFGISGVAAAEKLLEEAATNGGGEYFSADSTALLSESLRQIIASIVEDNTSFVAPVLPVSPENRTFSGSRVYMGFFKPQVNAFWRGNLKKYGLNDYGEITDKNGVLATNTDGSIKDNSTSFWSPSIDGVDIDRGGVGGLLLSRATGRDIYTYMGSSTDLTDSSNIFSTTNASITEVLIDVATIAEKDQVVNYVHGNDAYDDDANGITAELRDWIMGDILHSKPLAIHYATYTVAQENDCSHNKSVTFVGANDGMMHAFRDCDGKELWGFIPQDLLPYLKHMKDAVHTYYVDSSPTAYTYDADYDGNIEPGDGDKVIIIFGERRGGGFYYALDVTDPESPQYLWRLGATESPSGTSTDYSELGESWSRPSLGMVKVDVSGVETSKAVVFIGAGYDDVNEDALPDITNTKGRGVYVIEVATLDGSGVPSFTTSGHKVWGYTNADDSSLVDSIPSDVSILDINSDGYIDRVYVGDTGGNMWRFNTGATDTSSWIALNIFESNPGADSSTGRKIFFRPTVTLEAGYELLIFGTGDRAHPLETTTVDRLYAIKDIGQLTPKHESDLSDATSGSVYMSTTDGWFIKLNVNAGEKVLSRASAVSKVAYYTTYEPSAATVGDPCDTGTRGTARLYAMNHLTAAAAYNLNLSNDSGGTEVIDATDRSQVIGTGIPSGVVMVISPTGVSALIGVGGAIVSPDIDDTGSIIPTYWREVR
ncbi:MAG: hypothetical protein GY721_07185 [Deltaproteobacteria bacterium]|nr:hypothetical protein [Deltaproteobacteria bacterium]